MSFKKASGSVCALYTHTWNPVKQDEDSYNLQIKSLQANLGYGNTILIGNECDLFMPEIPPEWVFDIIIQMNKYPENNYVIKSNNTMRVLFYINKFPLKTTVATTIETNEKQFYTDDTPGTSSRYAGIKKIREQNINVIIYIDPVKKFIPLEMSSKIIPLKPEYVIFGASDKRNIFDDPDKKDVLKLIEYFLVNNIEVIAKKSMKRILGNEHYKH